MDFYSKYILKFENTDDQTYFKNIFEEKLPDFTYTSYPAVKDRGLWTWGHVIYDFRGYIDNMVKLKLNTIIIWNDFVPYNAVEMVAYAHSSNIKVYWGFSWGWDLPAENANEEYLSALSDEIVKCYETNYAALDGDGIYFQSFTEVEDERLGDVLIAEKVTEFVNQTADKIFRNHPDLKLQFGLHAVSVNKRLEYISRVNPKIQIIWEDCGSFPFDSIPQNIENFEQTMEFTEKICNLRGKGDKFGVVLKSLTNLDWPTFEHSKGPIYVGVSSKQTKEFLIRRKRKIWHYVQAYWLRNAEKAYEMIKLMREAKNGDLCIAALVEDGMFESKLYYPVALYTQMLWDCESDIKNIICETALRNDVEFA